MRTLRDRPWPFPARFHAMPRPAAAFLLLLATAALLGGCGDDRETTSLPEGPYLPQSSPASCLENLRIAYTSRDCDGYARLFHEDFAFVFNPDDVNNPDHPTPPSWLLPQELQSACNMFADSLVEGVNLLFHAGDPTPWTEIDSTGQLVRLDSVHLTVATRNDQGEPLYLVVQGAVQRLYFLTDPLRHASDGQPLVAIRKWEDSSIGGKGGGDCAPPAVATWGLIKHLYLDP